MSLLSKHAQTVGFAELGDICLPLLNIDPMKQYTMYAVYYAA